MSQDRNNPLNQVLTEMSYNKKVLTIYVNESIFNDAAPPKTVADNHKPEHSDAWCRCLGVFYAHSSTVEQDSDAKRDTPKDILHGFKDVPYLRVLFKPLFSSSDIKELMMPSTNRKRKGKLLIPFGCTDTIDITVPLERIKMIKRSEVLEEFIGSGRYIKYLVGDKKTPTSRREICEWNSSVGTEIIPQLVIECGELKQVSNRGCEIPSGSVNFSDGSINSDDSFSVSSSDSWEGESLDGELGVDNEKVTVRPSSQNTTRMGISVSIGELIKAIVLCSVAGANRFMGNCLHCVRGQSAGIPLPPTSALPAIFRVHPMPMPNRAMDVIGIGLRRDTVTDGVYLRCGSLQCSRIIYGSYCWEDLLSTTFKSILLRFTGRLNAFSLYAEHRKKKTLIPKIGEIEDFLLYVMSTIDPCDCHAKLRGWLSEQHAHSIPKSTKEYPKFAQFIKEVGRKLSLVLRTITVTNNGGDRPSAVAKLKTMLVGCIGRDTTGNVGFLAQQVIADVEEIFVDPFGEVVTQGMVLGNGSKDGFSMIRTCTGFDKQLAVETTLHSVIQFMNEQVSEDDLSMMGYARNDHCHGSVINKVNQRPFSATDAEHFLCKAWVIAKYTLPNYNTAKQPRSTKPHCHPVNLRGEQMTASMDVNVIMEGIVSLSTSKQNMLKAPSFCLMPNENSPEEETQLSSDNTSVH